MITDQPIPPVFWIFAADVVFYHAVVLYMFGYLKRSHSQAWAQIGSPSLWNASIKNNFLFLGFMIRRDYLTLGDPKLNRMCLLLWVLFSVAVVLFFDLVSLAFYPSQP